MNARIVRPLVVLAAVVAAFGIGFVAVRAVQRHVPHGQIAATYYCPMHPTYTSDRPGDCPICNMKLVKKEQDASSQLSAISHQQKTRDVCYLHNCPMAHEGKPCPMLVVSKKGEKVICPICGAHVAEAAEARHEKKLLYWTDPMIPGYKADKPGKSPMGMELVPVYEEEAIGGSAASIEGYAPILVSPQKQQLIGVKTAPVQKRAITKSIRTTGRIAYDPELYQAEQEYLSALKTWKQAQAGAISAVAEQAKQLIEASRMRLRLMGLSPSLLEEIGTWEGPDRRLLLAEPGTEAWVYATIYEYELPFVTLDQILTVDVPSIPGQVFEGAIRSIDTVLDPATRSVRVRALLADPTGLLKPEMFVNATITVPLGEVVAIPDEAVMNTGTRQVVFVAKGQGLFEPRDVTLGVTADGYDEVKRGVAEGETVVTSGNFLVDSESRLKAALQGTASEGHQHGQ